SLDAEPLTDGLLVIRHLFGFSGDALISGAVSGDAGRGDSGAIAGYLADAGLELDIDGDGESKPLTDGLLLIRYLFGFSGDSLISGAIGSGAERDTAEEVEAYIRDRVPVQ
ncbi:MAG: N-acetylgalactosamine 6-sulfatase (GALNS), partial [Bacteroidetes bacterium]|nr:N-acetylgalactosamine 6-sulfatase (GALNS) [Bacteroidota bacterium]